MREILFVNMYTHLIIHYLKNYMLKKLIICREKNKQYAYKRYFKILSFAR